MGWAVVENIITMLLACGLQRISELERRLRIPFGKFPCAQCGGPHDFDTSIPSVVWNGVIRAKSLPEYLCTTCIVREFARAGRGFTAELWNEEFNGIKIEFAVEGQNANDAALINEENNLLRNELAALRRANEEAWEQSAKMADEQAANFRRLRDEYLASDDSNERHYAEHELEQANYVLTQFAEMLRRAAPEAARQGNDANA